MTLFKKGQVLYYEGSPAFGVYCISEGKIKMVKSDGQGKETLLRLNEPGDLIGFQQIFKSGLHDVTAIAMEETKVCFIPRSSMKVWLEQQGSVAMELLVHLMRDIDEMQLRVSGNRGKNVRERTAFALLELDRRFGVDCSRGRRLSVHLSREEFASFIGIATETLIREISSLRDEGFLDQKGGEMVLLKYSDLRAVAGL